MYYRLILYIFLTVLHLYECLCHGPLIWVFWKLYSFLNRQKDESDLQLSLCLKDIRYVVSELFYKTKMEARSVGKMMQTEPGDWWEAGADV